METFQFHNLNAFFYGCGIFLMISSLNQTFSLFGAHSGQSSCQRASRTVLEKDRWALHVLIKKKSIVFIYYFIVEKKVFSTITRRSGGGQYGWWKK